jgi:hypothetical protein
MRITLLIGLGIVGSITAGCSSHGPSAATTTTTTKAPAVQNLAVTDAVRESLLEAGAASHDLSVSDYIGLDPGTTYYAYDSATHTYWAAAGLDPSPSSIQGQVSTQDDGSYLFLTRRANGTWTAQDDGLGGIGGTGCPAIPAAVVAAWNWAPGTCRPPASSTTTPTTTATTAPQVPAGFTAAKQEWVGGSNAISADQDSYFSKAASDLTSAINSGAPNVSGYQMAVQELQQLASLPDADLTSTQDSEFQNDTSALNTFFGTQGLYQ